MANPKVNINDAIESLGEKRLEEISNLELKLKKANLKVLSEYEKKLNKLIAKADVEDLIKLKREAEDKLQKAREKAQKEEAKAAALDQKEQDRQNIIDAKKARLEAEVDIHKKLLINATALGKVLSANGKSMAENMLNATSKMTHALTEGAEKAMDTYAKYYTGIATRLQNSGLSTQGIFSKISDLSAANPYFKLTSVLDNLSELVKEGVAENLTQRAFLATISDKIVTTFEATSKTLLNLIRIQGLDTTAARLGLEANLNRLFNYYFSDTSYLSTQFDNVLDILTGVSAQLGAQAGVEFEYQVQKWLGSLGSVGVSESTLSLIALGINYLGTGNIGALSSNQALQNLLVMASNRGGLSYGDILSKGITSVLANQLLYNVIDYIREISTSDNNVVRAQYADLFGISITDMAALSKVQQSTLDEIYKQAMSYKDTLTELNEQLDQVSSRVHLSEKISNILDNVMTATGMGIANNTLLYATYKAADMLEGITGGINLPFITAFGTGIDLNMSLEGLIKSGIMGISTIGTLMSALGNITGGMLNLEDWEYNANKGLGFKGYTNAGQLLTTTSSTTYVSNASATGLSQSLVDQQQSEGETITGTKVESADEIKEILEYLKSYFEGGGSLISPLKVEVSNYGLLLGRE